MCMLHIFLIPKQSLLYFIFLSKCVGKKNLCYFNVSMNDMAAGMGTKHHPEHAKEEMELKSVRDRRGNYI